MGAIKGVGCVVAFVVVTMGALLALGVPFLDMNASELAICVGLFVASGVFAWVATRDFSKLEPQWIAIAKSLGLRTKKLSIVGKLGGLEVEAQEVLLEGADKKHTPGWSVCVRTNERRPLVVLSADGVLTEQAAALRPVDVSNVLPPRYALRIADEAAGSLHREPLAAADWVSPELAAKLETIAGVLQIRTEGTELRVIVRRPLPDPLALRHAILFARSLVPPPLDVSRLPPEPRALPDGARRTSFSFARIASLVLFGAPLVVFGAIAPDCEGHESEALRLANACALARDSLGSPIERRLLGLQVSTSGTSHETEEVLVKGPRGDGVVTVRAYRRSTGTPWNERPLQRVTLETGARVIELQTCTDGGNTGIGGHPHRATGTVTAVSGAAPVPVGTTCTFAVTPMPTRVLPCRTVARCGSSVLIGATDTLGFSVCAVARPDGTGVVVVHEDRRTPRAEPTLTLDERTRSARLVAPGLDWTLHVALTDAQPPPPAP